LPIKPGDLVQITNSLGVNGHQPVKLGLIIGPKPAWTNTRFPVLVDDKILYIAEFELEVIDETR
jgi:hypothetical protein